MHFEDVSEYVDCIYFFLNGDKCRTVLKTLRSIVFGVIVTSSYGVCIISASHAKAQFNQNFSPCLQDVSKTTFLIKVLLVALICS